MMVQRFVVLVLAFALVASLTFAGAAQEEPTPTAMVDADNPAYGGILNVQGDNRKPHFDPKTWGVGKWWVTMGWDPLIAWDRTKTDRGTGEIKSTANHLQWPPLDLLAGQLAERFEQTDASHATLYLRRNVHWHDKPPVNGRLFNADDVITSWEVNTQNPQGGSVYAMRDKYTLTKRDDFTIDIEFAEPDPWTGKWSHELGVYFAETLAPKEVLTDPDYNTADWRNFHGTGPFILTDYIEGSRMVWERNENYWDHDPFFPENQLPYVDEVRMIAFADDATRMAAMRSGKWDIAQCCPFFNTKQAAELNETNPEMHLKTAISTTWMGWLRVDNEPWDDIRVRRAAMLAINQQEVRDVFYAGGATYPGFPVGSSAGRWHADVLDSRPDLKELYEYHPDKARELLAEAGYPNGFDAKLLTNLNRWGEQAQLYVNYLADVGIRLEIDNQEMSYVYGQAAAGERRPEDTLFTDVLVDDHGCTIFGFDCILGLWSFLPPGANYVTNVDPNSPEVQEIWDIFKEMKQSKEAYDRLWDTLYIKIVENVWVLDIGASADFVAWQPWVFGYDGVLMTEEFASWVYKYAWIDPAMKKEMTGRDADE